MKPKPLLLLLIFLLILSMSGCFKPADGTLKWAYEAGDMVSPPVVASDGTIYVGSGKKLCAINPDGTLQWAYEAGDRVYSPSIGPAGSIYVGAEDKKLYALNPNGTLKWVYEAGGNIYSPVVGVDGTIYAETFLGQCRFFAVNPDGTLRWEYEIRTGIYPFPAIGPDGTVYVGITNNELSALNPDGTLQWTYATEGNVSFPAIGPDGTIYAGAQKSLYAINPNGTRKWVYKIGNSVYSPTVGRDGIIYIGSDDRYLYAIKPDGYIQWKYLIGTVVLSPPVVGADGMVYVVSGKKLYALNPNGTLKWEYETGGTAGYSPVISLDRTIYVGSSDKKIYAIHCGSKGDWRNSRQNKDNRALSGMLALLVQKQDAEKFNYLTGDAGMDKSWKLYNSYQQKLTIEKAGFKSSQITLKTKLPLTIEPGETASLSAVFTPLKAGYYESECEMTYKVDRKAQTVVRKIFFGGIFLEDGSELADTAKQALSAYQACYAKDPDSAATINNKGVLYRLLGKYKLAEDCFIRALNKTKTANYGGIKMNLGVIRSDDKQTDQASLYYQQALQDFKKNEKRSTLAPQIYFNQAWEAYNGGQLATALAEVNKTIGHQKANEYLKAKAYVLRGAIYVKQKQPRLAEADFQKAMGLDSKGPIGGMAKENLALLP